MDNYPEHLAPEFEESGAVKTPFEEWWARVHPYFPNVPEDVARYWLHEHWSHSPYCWLPSKSYRFTLVTWPSKNLLQVRSVWCDWDPGNAGCLAHGRYLIEDLTKRSGYYCTGRYMLEHREFPSPIIVLDNRDGHLRRGQGYVPDWLEMPEAYVLIEGHRRFNMALYLLSIGQFSPTTKVWLMEPVLPQ